MTDGDDETFASCNPRNPVIFFFHVNVLGELKRRILCHKGFHSGHLLVNIRITVESQ